MKLKKVGTLVAILLIVVLLVALILVIKNSKENATSQDPNKTDAPKPTVTVTIGKTTLDTENVYQIDENKQIIINGIYTGEVSKIYYKIGTDDVVTVESAQANVTIPGKYLDTGEFSFKVVASGADGTLGEWVTYKIILGDLKAN